MRYDKATLKKFFAISFAALTLAGCQKNESSAPIASRAVGPRGSMGAMYGVSSSSLTGHVFADQSYQQKFQLAVTDFLSTDIDPRYVGSVSATGQFGSGVFIGGRVTLGTGSIRTYQGSYADISPNSSFSIQVRDYTGQNPAPPPLPAFSFTQAQGSINGNQVQVVFGDNYGTITLNGTLNQNTFDGDISFDNSVQFDGTRPGHAGTLGNFSVPICSFFACN